MTRRRLAFSATVLALAATAIGSGASAAPTPLPPNVALTQRSTTAGKGDSTVVTPVLQGLSGLDRRVSASILADLTRQAKLLANGAKAAHVSVDVTVYVAEQDKNYLSFRFETSAFSAGAAHPGEVPTTVTYVRSTGRRIGFADLFKGHEPAALKVLSQQTRAVIPTLLGSATTDAEVKDGTTPTVANLGGVIPRVTGVEVVFAPYQVAAYAAGEPSVIVPWSALRGLVSLPLPATVEPAAPYLGGLPTEATDDLSGIDVASAVSHSTNATVKAAAKSGYRLTDAVVLYGPAVNSATTYELVRLVPTANPAQAITLALTEGTKGVKLVDAQTGPAGCHAFTPTVLKALRAGCK